MKLTSLPLTRKRCRAWLQLPFLKTIAVIESKEILKRIRSTTTHSTGMSNRFINNWDLLQIHMKLDNQLLVINNYLSRVESMNYLLEPGQALQLTLNTTIFTHLLLKQLQPPAIKLSILRARMKERSRWDRLNFLRDQALPRSTNQDTISYKLSKRKSRRLRTEVNSSHTLKRIISRKEWSSTFPSIHSLKHQSTMRIRLPDMPKMQPRIRLRLILWTMTRSCSWTRLLIGTFTRWATTSPQPSSRCLPHHQMLLNCSSKISPIQASPREVPLRMEPQLSRPQSRAPSLALPPSVMWRTGC